MKALLIPIFLFLVAFPAHAQNGTMFTVYGQVFDTNGMPVNGVTVYLTVSGSTISAITATAERTNGSLVNGYYLLELANLPGAVSAGTSMTLSARYGSASASTTIARAANEPQRIDLNLSVPGVAAPSPPSPSGAGSEGGGGGGVSAEPFENILKKESRDEFIVKDLPAKYAFTTPELPVTEILITSTINAGMITVQVELLKSMSKLVKESAPVNVYKYINIWVGTSGFAVPQNIKEATIKFKVENSWITSGGIQDTDIALLRWDGTKWNPLETQLRNKDADFSYFEAKTNVFSPFAISAVKPPAVAVPTSPVITAVTPPVPMIPIVKPPSISLVYILIAFAVIALVAYFIVIRKLKKRE